MCTDKDFKDAKEAIECVEKLFDFAFQAKCLSLELGKMKHRILTILSCGDRLKKGSTFYSSLLELIDICEDDVIKFSDDLLYVIDSRYKMAISNGKLEDSK